MKNKYIIGMFVIILFMVIGYSNIVTELNMTNKASISKNLEDYNVVFSSVAADGEDAMELYSMARNTELEFELGPYLNENDEHFVSYRITNNSTQYDAEVVVSCSIANNINTTMTNSLANEVILAKSSKDGTIKIKLNETIDEEQYISCNATTNPIERDNKVEGDVVFLRSIIEEEYNKSNVDSSSLENQKTLLKMNEENSYYYYGNADNNNVLFGNLCYKIIRTNKDGSIRMIYNGFPVDGTCPNNGAGSILATKSAYSNNNTINYVYGEEKTNSLVKNVVDAFYTEYIDMLGLSEKLVDDIYCNDTSKITIDNEEIFSTVNRINTSAPSLICKNKEDSYTVGETGNGLLKHKISLPTADEILLTGSESYFNIKVPFWTMSPHSCKENECSMFGLDENGVLSSYKTDTELGLRPVITLKNDIQCLKGSGTTNNPYVLQ